MVHAANLYGGQCTLATRLIKPNDLIFKERERKNLEKRRKTILLSTERRQVTKDCAIDALYFQTNFIDKFLDDKILKFLLN